MNPNSLLYWWPKVMSLGIPVPRTRFVEINEGAASAVRMAAKAFGYPVFLRTDLCSGKHDWIKSCYVDGPNNIEAHIKAVIAANERWTMLGIHYQILVVREFLDLETAFTAFAGDMPINKERRYFIEDGKIICHHPYWPTTAFNRHEARMAHDPDWQRKLASISALDGSESVIEAHIKKLACLPGRWSADFAKGKNGIWYLIDMAIGGNSYHMPHN